MRRLFIYIVVAIIMLAVTTACNDDPNLSFKGYDGTYSMNDGTVAEITLNGFTLTDKSSGVTFSFDSDNLATVTLTRVVPGYGTLTVGGVLVTRNPDGEGLAFQGQMLISETELLKFSGTIISGNLTINLVTTTPPAQA